MDMNLRKDANFVQDESWYKHSKRYDEFLNETNGKSGVLLEIGVGFNTPGIIRFPFEQKAYEDSQTTLIRINRDYPHAMIEMKDKLISFDEDSNKIIDDLKEE